MDIMDKSVGQSRRRRIGWLFLAGGALFSALGWIPFNVWTAPLGVAWHLFHGNFESFEGHRIPVPWDMLALRSRSGGLTIVRQAPKYSILRSPAGIILLARVPGRAVDMSKDYDRVARANEPPNGYRVQALRHIPMAKGTAYCWELARNDSAYLSISCWFDKDTLAASYGGSPAYRQEFYNMLAMVGGPR